jgi:hypothetical protein
VRLKAPMKLGLCPKPRFGGNRSIASRFWPANRVGGANQQVTQRF